MDLAHDILIKFSVTVFFSKYFKFRNLGKENQNYKHISESIFVNVKIAFRRHRNGFLTKAQDYLWISVYHILSGNLKVDRD